jgi:hypothetical protein
LAGDEVLPEPLTKEEQKQIDEAVEAARNSGDRDRGAW